MPSKQTRLVNVERIRELADKKGWSDKQIAMHAAIDPGTVARALRKREPISLEKITNIAIALRVEPGEIILQEERSRPLTVCSIKLDMKVPETELPSVMKVILSALEQRCSADWGIVGISAELGSVNIVAIMDSDDFARLQVVADAGDLRDLNVIEIRSLRVLASAPVHSSSRRWPGLSDDVGDDCHEVEEARPFREVAYFPTRYTPRALITRGGSADVFMADDRLLYRRVWIKTLSFACSGDRRAADFLLREARCLAMCWHPNIIPLLDAGNSDVSDVPYLVMPSYQSLRAVWDDDDRALSPVRATAIALAIARAIEHCHSKGIIHRAIVPYDILATPGTGAPDQCMLSDFSVARFFTPPYESDLFEEQSQIGYPGFASPEQFSFEMREVDQRTDIFGLGATYVALLTGVVPGSLERLMQIRDPAQPGTLFPEGLRLPHAMQSFCEKCMAINPVNRFQTAAEMIQALEKLSAKRKWWQ